MSTAPDDKKKRFKAIAGGKTAPRSPTKSGKKRITNLTKPHIWVSGPA
jgi:hypothetical protein